MSTFSPPNIISSLSYLKASNFIGTLKLFPSTVIWDEVWHDLHNCVIFILADYFNKFIQKNWVTYFVCTLWIYLYKYISVLLHFALFWFWKKNLFVFMLKKITFLLIKTVCEINCHEMFSLYKNILARFSYLSTCT